MQRCFAICISGVNIGFVAEYYVMIWELATAAAYWSAVAPLLRYYRSSGRDWGTSIGGETENRAYYFFSCLGGKVETVSALVISDGEVYSGVYESLHDYAQVLFKHRRVVSQDGM